MAEQNEARLGNMCRARDRMHPAKVSEPDQAIIVEWMDHGAPLGGTSGVTDHGELTGLTDDDHQQYHNDARAYTQSQVNTIQSNLQGEIDSDITAHSGLPNVHHTAFVAADCDTKITTHTQNASAHHTAFVAADVAYLDKLCMYGSANAEWVPLCFEAASPDDDNIGVPTGATVVEISNVVYAAAQWLYGLGMPPAKNGHKLYVAANGVRYYLSAANGTNYVADGWLIGVNSAGTATTIYTDTTDRNAAALVTFANSLTDLSSYEKVFVKLSSTQATANALKVKFVSMLVYYGT